MREVWKWMLVVVLTLSAGTFRAAGQQATPKPPEKARYGVPVEVLIGRTVAFPDFELRYLGQRESDSPPPIVYWDYELTGGDGKKVVTTASLGNIAPNPFCYAGKPYYVERDISTFEGKDKRLWPYEIVVWKAPANSEIECKDGYPRRAQ
jgi:hypothetical protein